MSAHRIGITTTPPRPPTPDGPVLQVLGPMSARYAGHEVPLGPPRRRALLALLLIRLGRVVPTSALVEGLWRDDPPLRAVATLQSHVSHLRRSLAPAGGPGGASVLRYQAPGYVLQLSPDQVDAQLFEQLASSGRQLLTRDPLAARDRLTRALSLWRGAPYAEFAAHQPLADESTRLEQVRLTTLEASAEAALALGRPAEVVTELEREARQHPTRERLVGHLMTALFRTGRQAEALKVYEWTRGHLVEEYGVDTTAELQRLHVALLRQELGDEEPAGAPGRWAASGSAGVSVGAPPVSGAAPRAVATTARSCAAGPAARSRAPRVRPIPYEPSPRRPGTAPPMTGRDRELRRLVVATAGAAEGRGHLSCVFGSSGLGKTHLVMELAQRIRDGDSDIETVRGSSFSGEGVPQYWLWTQVLRLLSASRPDAFQEAAAPFGTLLAPLLPGWREAGTSGGQGCEPEGSRDPFRVHDAVCEILFALAARRPLVLLLEDVHWADTASLEVLRLLATRRQGQCLSLVLTGWDLEAWPDASRFRLMTEVLKGPRTEILRLTGLARSDVAVLVHAQAGPGVDERLVDALHRQGTGSPYFVLQMLSYLGGARDLRDSGAADELLGLVTAYARKVLRQEFAMLPEPFLRLLRLCAVVAPDIEVDALCRASDGNSAIALVESAIRYGLLAPDPNRPGRLRLGCPQAQEVLTAELTDAARERLHARYAEALSMRPDAESAPEQADRVAHHAWHARGAMPAQRVLPWLLRAAANAEPRLASDDRETWLRRAMRTVRLLPDDASARELEHRLHLELGQLLAHVRGFGDTEAEAEFNRGRAEEAGTADDPVALSMLGASLLVRGRYDDSRQLALLLRDIAERTDEPTARLGAAYGEATVLFVRGRLSEALAELEQGVGLADRYSREGRLPERMYQSDPRVYFRCYEVLARWLTGDRDTVAEQRRGLLRLTRHDSRPWDRIHALYSHAVVATWEGDVETARSSCAEGIGLAVEHGLYYWKMMLRLPLGWALAHSGRGEGIAEMRDALAELRLSGTRIRQPLHLGLLAQAQHHVGQVEEAVDTLRTLLAVVELRSEYVYLHSALPATRLLRDLLGGGLLEPSLRE
ncbi:BTAD domain-containing putative transcriptional regulator [Streptomyces sp. NPDC014646]|uniref:BTAD domain-containing putative transcriptional regulator n=1 Tax=Streptomyces sp. NPDC014646 TaxID=3364877 RepID=UPI0036FDDC8B